MTEALSAKSRSSQKKRQMPHSLESEQALLGCCLLDGSQETLSACIEAKLTPEAFFYPANQTVFKALLTFYENKKPINEILLGDYLTSIGELETLGGLPYINALTDRIDTPLHRAHYLQQVRDLWVVRKLINVATKTVEQAYTNYGDLDGFLETVEQTFFKIREDRITESAKSLKEPIALAMGAIHRMIQNRGQLEGIPSGFSDFDRLANGLKPQEMIVIAARPSMGKTSIALNIAEAATLHPDPKRRVSTLVFSLEMSATQLAMRLLCGYARADMQKLRDGFMDKSSEASISNAARVLQNSPLWIDDSGFMTILEMRAKARRLSAQKDLGLVIIDYLQLINGSDPRVPREQQISEISRGVKAMAKELNVPVIVLSQLNRDSEKEKRQPRLSDLRESGAIEQDADMVLLLSKKKDFDDEQEQQSQVVERDLILAKNRNGPIGIVPLIFNKTLTRFESYSRSVEL